MSKKISIIVPCYNVEKYIDRCFDSLENQTLGIDAMEIIFVNDASTDNTYEKLINFEHKYPDSVIIINFKNNRRQATARNIAIEYASAPIIGYMDSDDSIDYRMYETMIDQLIHYDCDFVQCRFDCIDGINNLGISKPFVPEGYLDLSDPYTYQQFIVPRVGLVSVCDKIYKKSFLIDNDIYCPEQVIFEDIFFSFLVFTYATSTYATNDIFYHYHTNPHSTLHTKKENYYEDDMNVCLDFLRVATERGLLDKRRETVEWLFLEKYYVYMLWDIFKNYPNLSFSIYNEMRDTILELVPNYKNNSYRFVEGNEFDDIMLKLLDHELNESQLMFLANNMLKKFNI